MKLYTGDNAELMEVTELKVEANRLIVLGTIMGAMPIEAILTPAELRKVFKIMKVRTFFAILRMLFSK